MYSSDREHPTVIRIRIRMRDLVDPDCMRYAVDGQTRRGRNTDHRPDSERV